MTYRQLGELLRRGEGDEPGRVESRLREEGKRAAALRCVVAERSKVENMVVLRAFVKVVRWICPFVQVITCICQVLTYKVENVVGMPLVVPRTIDFDTCSYDDLADYALPSEKREM